RHLGHRPDHRRRPRHRPRRRPAQHPPARPPLLPAALPLPVPGLQAPHRRPPGPPLPRPPRAHLLRLLRQPRQPPPHRRRPRLPTPERATAQDDEPGLLHALPMLGDILTGAPASLQARLFAAFGLELIYNKEDHQVSIYATITPSTPAALADIIAASEPPATP